MIINTTSTSSISFYETVCKKKSKTPIHNFNIIVLGDVNVGKTSFLCEYLLEDRNETIRDRFIYPARYMHHKICHDQHKVHFALFEVNCSEKFKETAKCYVENCDGAIILFDLTQELSFYNLNDYFSVINELSENASIIVVGNKKDLKQQRKVSVAEINNYLPKFIDLWNYFETFKDDREGICKVFDKLTSNLLEREKRNKVTTKIEKFEKSIEEFTISSERLGINPSKSFISIKYDESDESNTSKNEEKKVKIADSILEDDVMNLNDEDKKVKTLKIIDVLFDEEFIESNSLGVCGSKCCIC